MVKDLFMRLLKEVLQLLSALKNAKLKVKILKSLRQKM